MTTPTTPTTFNDLPLSADVTTDGTVLLFNGTSFVRTKVSDLIKGMKRYSLPALQTAAMDLNESQVYRFEITGPLVLSFLNEPTSDRYMPVIVHFIGDASGVTWPANVEWDGNVPPELGLNETVITLLWVGNKWLANRFAAR